jgi:hypothetical protein
MFRELTIGSVELDLLSWRNLLEDITWMLESAC